MPRVCRSGSSFHLYAQCLYAQLKTRMMYATFGIPKMSNRFRESIERLERIVEGMSFPSEGEKAKLAYLPVLDSFFSILKK